jgi:serine/threonine protein kinase/tetratricopeptide (TPR) repeat protein
MSEEVLLEFIERELPPGASTAVEQHLFDCDLCRELLAAVADGAPEGSLPTDTGPTTPERGHRYQVLKAIAAGGMGIIYAARDRQLDRMVALKILRAVARGEAPEALDAHVLHEARAMARLAHPNVVAVYDIGVLDGLVFVAMEFVEGSSLAEWLRKPRDWAEVLDVFLAAGSGLAAAHAAGIVHRDFKPDNVLIGKDGRVRVTDFGLSSLAAKPAAAAPQDLPSDSSPPHASVSSGALVGSPAYMAPEQLQGRRADERSDVFSFCVALWEALFGERPFAGETIGELERDIRKGALRQLRGDRRVPGWLVSALEQGLAASPTERHPSMDALLSRLREGPLARPRRRLPIALSIVLLTLLGFTVAIRAIVSPRDMEGRAPSVAVLPFRNLSGDEQGEYLADGVTEDLILLLAKVRGLKVTGRASVFAFKGQQMDARLIGERLGVEATLSGSVRRSGDRLRFVVRMIETRTGSELWSETLDGDSKDLFGVYGRIGRGVARTLRLKPINESAAAATPRLENPEAHSLVLKGRYLALQPLRLRDALAAFDRAIALDPSNAAAYAGASVVHARLGSWTADAKASPGEELSQAVRAARRALELDATEGLAHAVLGYLENHFDWDVPGAEAEFKEALRLRPNDVDVLHWYAHFLASQGRFDEELAVTRQGLEMDPLHRYIGSHLAFHYLFTRHYSQATQEAEKALQLFPDEPFAMLYSAMASELSGERQRAVAQLSRLETIRPGWLFARAQLGFTYARMGRSVEAWQIFDDLSRLAQEQYVPPPYLALILVGLGKRDAAFGQLERGLADHSWWMTYLMIDPRFDGLRDDPRFAAILKRVSSERGPDGETRGSPR